jgi:hypothetical protein
MKISRRQVIEHEGLVRVSAMVEWENCDQPQREIYIETEHTFADDIACNPHAFIIGCLIPAMRFGEQRIQMDAEICPGLKEGLETIMSLVSYWSGGKFSPLHIDLKTGSTVKYIKQERQAGLFLSGGIDSLAALRLNKLIYPEDHPGVIKDCLLVHGFDIGGVVARGAKHHVFERAKSAMSLVAKDANVNLIPV